METRRDIKTGAITVTGKEFCIVIQETGHIVVNGNFTIEEPAPAEKSDNAVSTNPDAPSPRSKPAIRKRGAR